MVKAKSRYVCQNCGASFVKWAGRCENCGEWNTLLEQAPSVETESKTALSRGAVSGKKLEAVSINTIEPSDAGSRLSTSFADLDAVLGGGLLLGSVNLLAGQPGIGKSTLLMQICAAVAEGHQVLYVSGEESAGQVKLRAIRLGASSDKLHFASSTSGNDIAKTIEGGEYDLVIVDSIQTLSMAEISSAPGTVSQVSNCGNLIIRAAKTSNTAVVIVGHVTKDGNIAGPRVLEHMVDTVLYLEGERYFSYRILRSVKNRFGSTNEVGMFEMKNEGMIEVTNPSSVLISEDEDRVPGAAIVCSLEGTRALLVELQALTTTTVYGIPKRTGNGIDFNKIALLIAVLEKRGRINLSNQDVYLNVVSGMKLNEPAVDLGAALAIVSSFKSIYIPKDTAIIGEVGLTGEIRSVNLIDKRLKECEKLGIKRVIIPQNNKKLLKDKYKLDIIGVRNINEALKAIGI